MMMKSSGDSDRPRQQTNGGIPLQDMAELSFVGICNPNSQFELNPCRHINQCSCVRSRVMRSYVDVKYMLSSRIHHLLHPLDQVRGVPNSVALL